MTDDLSVLAERLGRVERQVANCSDSFEAPSGKIMCRVWIVDLAAVAKLAREALRSQENSHGK